MDNNNNLKSLYLMTVDTFSYPVGKSYAVLHRATEDWFYELRIGGFV